MRVLVVNAGSSSVKLALVDEDERTPDVRNQAAGEPIAREPAAVELPAPRTRGDADVLARALDGPLGEADAVGHRIVHGGERHRRAVRIDAGVEAELRGLCELAPLHQPKSLAAMDAVTRALPDVPAVACFDTAFHATLAPAAYTYALPAAWRERWGLRRYGFHGLSHAWVARRAAQLLGRDDLRVVSCHLGAGASLCAIRDGVSIDTTMGFTPLEGLVMATRSGSVDPGMLLWVAERHEASLAEMTEALEHESGLLGLAGSADMREVLAWAGAGDGRARLALDVYVHRLRGGIAAMAASLGGIDALAFTGGVGERSARVRALAAQRLAFLGVALDERRNEGIDGDGEIGGPDSAVRTLVVQAREDLEIARQVRSLLS